MVYGFRAMVSVCGPPTTSHFVPDGQSTAQDINQAVRTNAASLPPPLASEPLQLAAGQEYHDSLSDEQGTCHLLKSLMDSCYPQLEGNPNAM